MPSLTSDELRQFQNHQRRAVYSNTYLANEYNKAHGTTYMIVPGTYLTVVHFFMSNEGTFLTRGQMLKCVKTAASAADCIFQTMNNLLITIPIGCVNSDLIRVL